MGRVIVRANHTPPTVPSAATSNMAITLLRVPR